MESRKEEDSFLKFHLKARLKKLTCFVGQTTLLVEKKHLLSVLKTLKTHASLRYTQLMDVCSVDYLGQSKPRFEVVYHLLSMYFNQRIRLKVPLKENESLPSSISLFSSADWFEREVYDMFGIHFDDHPNLKRILTDYNFKGHPLLKDFPIMGHTQMRYDKDKKEVVEEPVHLEQAYRTFDTCSPWKGMDKAIAQIEKSKKTTQRSQNET